MHVHTRALVRFMGIILYAIMSTTQAQPASYPSKPINLIVPFPAGGPTDLMARALAEKLGERLGETIVVNNRSGAGGTIGAEAAARAPADGYTLFFATTGTMVIAPNLYKNLSFDPVTDFAPVSLMATTMNVLVANPDVPIRTVTDLIKLAKERPGNLTFGSSGNGSSTHLCGELLRSLAGIEITHIPYKGSAPAIVDLLGGRIDLMFDTVLTQLQNISSGKARAIAVTGTERSAVLPDVPTFQESGLKEYDVTTWFGVLAPAGTPEAIIEKLSSEIGAVMATEDMIKRVQINGAKAEKSSPSEFSELIKTDLKRWGAIIEDSGTSIN